MKIVYFPQAVRSLFSGDRTFYRKTLAIAVPIMIQNGITNLVGMLDNIMVGRIGTAQMSGVSIVNQLLFVFHLCVFGGISGAGIFTAQYYGQRNQEGVRHTFRFKLILTILLSVAGLAVLGLLQDRLILLYLHEEGDTARVAETFAYAKSYLHVMLLELFPFAIGQAYAGTLRECSDTMLPMKAGVTAVFVNLIFNYILIFGKFGAPALGVEGAAAATLISRFVELGIIVIYTHTHSQRHPFVTGALHSLRIPAALVRRIIVKGTPLLMNEALWAAGETVLLQNYSVRGLDVIAAMNISSTLANVFNVVFIAMGSAIAIILGQELGENNPDAKQDAQRLILFSVLICTVSGSLMLLFAPFFPRIYNTEETIRRMAVSLLVIRACCSPIYAYQNAAYFTIRSGGKTFITFLFDSCFVWTVSIPLAFVLTRFTDLGIVRIFLICELAGLIKCVIGHIMVQKGSWIQNLTEIE